MLTLSASWWTIVKFTELKIKKKINPFFSISKETIFKKYSILDYLLLIMAKLVHLEWPRFILTWSILPENVFLIVYVFSRVLSCFG